MCEREREGSLDKTVMSRLGILEEPLSLNGKHETIFKCTPPRKTRRLREKEP